MREWRSGHPGGDAMVDGDAVVRVEGTPPSPGTARVGQLARHDPAGADLVRRLLLVATRALAQAYLGDKFSFTLRPGPGDPLRPASQGAQSAARRSSLSPAGVSARYSVIAALGLRYLPESDQRAVLGGADCDDLLGLLAKGLDDLTGAGDVALFCWAAAEAGHSELPHAIDRLRWLDRRWLAAWPARPDDQLDVVSAAWVVTALVAARALADVEEHLTVARDRLMGARRAVFPHLIGGKPPWYRAHVGSFADQIYPVQALARLHASADDSGARAVAQDVAGVLCQAQGPAGQWWWHYDARSGAVVERYPVYSVHQHAMAPMALFDLADAGGGTGLDPICAGLRWLAAPAETTERLIVDELPVIWRKVARNDPRKLVRGLAAAGTAIWPGTSVPGADRLYPPIAVDRECRPYELGWLLYAWLRGGTS